MDPAQGWRELRDIQTRAIHVIRDSQADVIVAASTAGGKPRLLSCL
jgi:ATP-dependent Lhr-like helicase